MEGWTYQALVFQLLRLLHSFCCLARFAGEPLLVAVAKGATKREMASDLAREGCTARNGQMLSATQVKRLMARLGLQCRASAVETSSAFPIGALPLSSRGQVFYPKNQFAVANRLEVYMINEPL